MLDLPVERTDDFNKIRKQYRKISLSVHPDKNRHPQASQKSQVTSHKLQVASHKLQVTSYNPNPNPHRHPQADAAFRKVYGAFETLSDMGQQRRPLLELGLACNL